jgi:site-specific DNA-methyltransferase (adenine-specific)
MDIETVKIDELDLDPRNARKHDAKNLKAIADSLEQFGQRKPIVVWGKTVVAGNGTMAAARSLGWTQISIVRVPDDWSADQVKAYALADNRSAELASWDEQVLASQLLELQEAEFDIELLGFELPVDELQEVVEDEIPEQVEPKSKLGDVWQLGRHRLVCGDSNDDKTLNKLLQGNKLDAIIQDPPYGVLDVEWDRPLTQQDLNTALASTDGPIFMFNATKPKLFKGILDLKPQADRILVWRMTAGITGKGGMFWTWQPIFVWNANRKMIGWDSIEFESAAPTRTGEHLTQKPIGLIAKYISNIPNAETIGDFFGGSGTTLLACEQTDRTCFMMELNPKYVDVIIARWEKLTGQTAELITD